jgi:hypothetical protein
MVAWRLRPWGRQIDLNHFVPNKELKLYYLHPKLLNDAKIDLSMEYFDIS